MSAVAPGAGAGRAKKLHGDKLKFLVRIGGRHHIGIVGGRPGGGRMAGKNLVPVQNIEIGIELQSLKCRRRLGGNVELRRVGLIIIKPAQQVVEGAVLHHHHHDMFNVIQRHKIFL